MQRLAGRLLSSASLRSTPRLSFIQTRFTSSSPNSTEQNYSALRHQELREAGWAPYPPHFSVSTTVSAFSKQYETLAAGERVNDTEVRLCGRISVRREASKKLIFMDIVTPDGKMQVMCAFQNYEGPDFLKVTKVLRIGDIIGVRGIPAKTKAGELSVLAKELQLLSPCLEDLPQVLTSTEIRFRQRYLDLIVNEQTRETFRKRSLLISSLRQYLTQTGFLEVETPILWTQAGGANAHPFWTLPARGFGMPLVMRVAPELFLKQLVIGGLHKVFEIGKLFRNEGVDPSHNPEFTSCEFYQAYANLDDLFKMTQDLLRSLLQSTTQGTTITSPKGTSLDFSVEFKRMEIMPSLEHHLQRTLPDPNSPASLPAYAELCESLGVKVAAPVTLARCLDKLIGHVLEPLCVQPTFLTHHPHVLSPLAKSSVSKPGMTQRFELFVDGKEIVNAYEELNDPEEQRQRFRDQSGEDEESQVPDEAFCTALGYGLPPTVGWGMGLDRFCMMLCGHSHIREVLLFPVMRPKEDITEKLKQ